MKIVGVKFVVVNSVPMCVTKKWLLARAAKVWRVLGRTRESGARRANKKWSSATLVFVSKSEMQRLNKQFRGKNYPTDVLSFAPSEAGSIGELVFCTDVLKKQAREHELSYQLELTYMLIHGLLHLLGHDHEVSTAAAKKMFKIQDEIFAKLS